MEETSSSNAREEEMEFEDVWSDLHALKKLYGLLQKSNGKIPQGQIPDSLDEKSRLLLRKLLDGATQHALRSQAKIVFCTPEPDHHPSEQAPTEPTLSRQQEPPNSENSPNCHPASTIVIKREAKDDDRPAESTCGEGQGEAYASKLVAGMEFSEKRCPVCVKGNLERKHSTLSTIRLSDTESLKTAKPILPNPRRPIHHNSRDRQASIVVRASKGGSRREESEQLKERQVQRDHRPPLLLGPSEKKTSPVPGRARSPDDVAPCYKRNRVESPCRCGEFVTQTKGKREGHHRPSSSGGTTMTTKPKPSQRIEGGAADLPRRIGSFKDPTARMHQEKDTVVGSGRKHYTANLSSRHGVVAAEEPPSRRPDERVNPRRQLSRLRAMRIRGSGRHQSRETSVGRRHQSKPERYSSASASSSASVTSESTSSSTTASVGTPTRRSNAGPRAADQRSNTAKKDQILRLRTPSQCSSSLALVPARRRAPHNREEAPRRRPPSRMPSQHRKTTNGAQHAKSGKEKKKKKKAEELGRLQRFKNKLAIIFHHHHHHHHHLHHEGHAVVAEHGARHHISPWRYLRKLLPRKRQELAAERAAAKQGKHGYLHLLLDALLQHVWGTRQRRAAKARRRRLGSKKLHWWQRFRRRGGVKLAGRKKPRLRLGFTRARSRAGTKKV